MSCCFCGQPLKRVYLNVPHLSNTYVHYNEGDVCGLPREEWDRAPTLLERVLSPEPIIVWGKPPGQIIVFPAGSRADEEGLLR